MENLPTWVGVVLGIVPAAIVLFTVKGADSWRLSTLISGILLVLIATLLLGLMTDFSSLYDVLGKQGKVATKVASSAKSNIGLWVVMFPAIVGAVGANYITAWFQSSKPKQS